MKDSSRVRIPLYYILDLVVKDELLKDHLLMSHMKGNEARESHKQTAINNKFGSPFDHDIFFSASCS